MKKTISIFLTVLTLAGLLTVFVSARGTAYHTVWNFEDLEDVIDDLDSGYDVFISIANDIKFDDYLEIDTSDVAIHFIGPATLTLDGTRGFYVDDDHVSLYFENVTIKGIKRYKGDGQAIYVNDEYCRISGARFENCSTYELNAVFSGMDYCGGAIDVDGENCTIENCYFKDCSAQSDAGAIYIDDEGCTVSKCTFEKCFSRNAGGAIYVCYEQTNADIIDCTFIDCGYNFNKIGKNVFAINDNGTVIRPNPYSKDDELYHGCTVYSAEEYEKQMSAIRTFLKWLGWGSTLSEGNVWIVAAIAGAAVIAVVVIVIVKKKNKKKPVSENKTEEE